MRKVINHLADHHLNKTRDDYQSNDDKTRSGDDGSDDSSSSSSSDSNDSSSDSNDSSSDDSSDYSSKAEFRARYGAGKHFIASKPSSPPRADRDKDGLVDTPKRNNRSKDSSKSGGEEKEGSIDEACNGENADDDVSEKKGSIEEACDGENADDDGSAGTLSIDPADLGVDTKNADHLEDAEYTYCKNLIES